MNIYVLEIQCTTEGTEGDHAHFSAHSTRAGAAQALREFARRYLGKEPPADPRDIASFLMSAEAQPASPDEPEAGFINLWCCEPDGDTEWLNPESADWTDPEPRAAA